MIALFMVFPFVGCEIAPVMSVSDSVVVQTYRMLVPNQTETGHGAWSAWRPVPSVRKMIAAIPAWIRWDMEVGKAGLRVDGTVFAGEGKTVF
jgi:hypothetical protein